MADRAGRSAGSVVLGDPYGSARLLAVTRWRRHPSDAARGEPMRSLFRAQMRPIFRNRCQFPLWVSFGVSFSVRYSEWNNTVHWWIHYFYFDADMFQQWISSYDLRQRIPLHGTLRSSEPQCGFASTSRVQYGAYNGCNFVVAWLHVG